jgi:capsular polysaccharide biosynthesis protein
MSAAGHTSPPVRCDTLRAITERAGGIWREDAPARALEYALPAHATPEVAAYLRTRARATAPARGLARLPVGLVFGAGVAISGDGTTLARDVAEDFGKAADEHWLLGRDRLRAPEPLDGVTAVVAVNRGAGYCHWLLEELPRLLALQRGAADRVILHATTPFARAALAARGGPETLVAVRRESFFAAAPLLVPTLVAEAGAPTPEAMAALRDFAGPLGRANGDLAAADAAGERVYFSRARATRRRVANEEALWHALRARGFTRVFLEELDWPAQLAVARRARVVAAPHGAGLANLAFCAPGTRVVELVNRAYFNPVFWRLAALGGLDYRPVVSGEGDLREERTRNRDDLTADVAAVLAAVDAG